MSQRIGRERPTFAVIALEHGIRESNERSDHHDQAQCLLADGAHGGAGAGGRHCRRRGRAAGGSARLLALEWRDMGVARWAGLRTRLLPGAGLLPALPVLPRLLWLRLRIPWPLLLRAVGGVLVPRPLIPGRTYQKPGTGDGSWLPDSWSRVPEA